MAAGLDLFKPEIWAGRLLHNLDNAHVFAKLLNRDYEGEIKAFGDVVHINNIGRVTVVDYTANSDLTAAETLTSFQRDLTINQSKAFHFQVDDVDAAQVKPKLMDEAMREAGYALAEVTDDFLATTLSAGTTNIINATGTNKPTADTAYEYLVDMGTKLSESNTPKEGRWVVIPAWFHALLLKDDRFVTYDKVGDVISNGKVGRAAGFDIYESNNLLNSNSATYTIVAGHKMAASYAEQINKVKAYEMEKRFNQAVKGLHLYGAKLVRPECVCTLVAERAAVVS